MLQRFRDLFFQPNRRSDTLQANSQSDFDARQANAQDDRSSLCDNEGNLYVMPKSTTPERKTTETTTYSPTNTNESVEDSVQDENMLPPGISRLSLYVQTLYTEALISNLAPPSPPN